MTLFSNPESWAVSAVGQRSTYLWVCAATVGMACLFYLGILNRMPDATVGDQVGAAIMVGALCAALPLMHLRALRAVVLCLVQHDPAPGDSTSETALGNGPAGRDHEPNRLRESQEP